MKKRDLLLTITFGLLISSCSKENESIINLQSSKIKKIIKLENPGISDRASNEYQYNEDGYIIGSIYNARTSNNRLPRQRLYGSENKIIAIRDNSNSSERYNQEYFYDDLGRLIRTVSKRKYSDNSTENLKDLNIEYLNENEFKAYDLIRRFGTETFILDSDTKIVSALLDDRNFYYDSKKNLIKIEFSPSNETEKTVFTYDNKINPFYILNNSEYINIFIDNFYRKEYSSIYYAADSKYLSLFKNNINSITTYIDGKKDHEQVMNFSYSNGRIIFVEEVFTNYKENGSVSYTYTTNFEIEYYD